MVPYKRREFLSGVGAAAVAAPAAALLLQNKKAKGSQKVEKIKIGQIGTTHAHASGKMSTMRKFSDQFEVVGVVEPDKQRRESLKNNPTYRDLKWMSQEQLLNTPGLQAVAVETEVRDLIPTAAQCVAAGMHIHLDKPAGETLAPFKALLDDATRRDRVVQMGYMYRYNPAFQFLFKAVRQGWLGEVFELEGVMSKTVGAETRKRLAEYPGGSMFELGCHILDALVVVLGRPNKVTPFVRRTRPEQDNLADNQLAVFEYPKATATLRSALIEVDGGRRRQFVVCGDRGTVVILPLEPPQLYLTLAEDAGGFRKGTQKIKLPVLGGRYDGDFLDLAKIIRDEKTADFSPEHDLAVQEALLLASGLDL